MALILSGDTGVPASGMPTGSVIQTVNAILYGGVATSSTTGVATGVTATITPISTTSKILISYQINGMQKNTGATDAGVRLWLYRNGSTIFVPQGGRTGDYFGYTNSNSTNDIAGSGFEYLDSPATISAVTYAVYFGSSSSGQSVNINAGADYSSITLQEIKQ